MDGKSWNSTLDTCVDQNSKNMDNALLQNVDFLNIGSAGINYSRFLNQPPDGFDVCQQGGGYQIQNPGFGNLLSSAILSWTLGSDVTTGVNLNWVVDKNGDQETLDSSVVWANTSKYLDETSIPGAPICTDNESGSQNSCFHSTSLLGGYASTDKPTSVCNVLAEQLPEKSYGNNWYTFVKTQEQGLPLDQYCVAGCAQLDWSGSDALGYRKKCCTGFADPSSENYGGPDLNYAVICEPTWDANYNPPQEKWGTTYKGAGCDNAFYSPTGPDDDEHNYCARTESGESLPRIFTDSYCKSWCLPTGSTSPKSSCSELKQKFCRSKCENGCDECPSICQCMYPNCSPTYQLKQEGTLNALVPVECWLPECAHNSGDPTKDAVLRDNQKNTKCPNVDITCEMGGISVSLCSDADPNSTTSSSCLNNNVTMIQHCGTGTTPPCPMGLSHFGSGEDVVCSGVGICHITGDNQGTCKCPLNFSGNACQTPN
tara:strand:+ start:25 stop:1479 length:1455 start_codon:yes stop_codon:yes gene_type:complete